MWHCHATDHVFRHNSREMPTGRAGLVLAGLPASVSLRMIVSGVYRLSAMILFSRQL